MNNIVERIEKLFAERGQSLFVGDMTQTEHSVQCAQLALREGESIELVVAALLHDIGHLLTEIQDRAANHDMLGSDFLKDYYPASVTEPIRLHAQARRYLCTVNPSYMEALTSPELYALHRKGGLMSRMELEAFQREPFFTEAIKLRHWDDEQKNPVLASVPFDQFRGYLRSALFIGMDKRELYADQLQA